MTLPPNISWDIFNKSKMINFNIPCFLTKFNNSNWKPTLPQYLEGEKVYITKANITATKSWQISLT